MRKRLVQTAFLTLGLTLVINTSAPSWAGQYVEREDCAEAAAKTKPMPPGCANRRVLKTPEVVKNRQGQQSCRIEMVEYLCQEPNGHQSLSKRAEYFPLTSSGRQQSDVFNSNSGEQAKPPAESQPPSQPATSEQPAGGYQYNPETGRYELGTSKAEEIQKNPQASYPTPTMIKPQPQSLRGGAQQNSQRAGGRTKSGVLKVSVPGEKTARVRIKVYPFQEDRQKIQGVVEKEWDNEQRMWKPNYFKYAWGKVARNANGQDTFEFTKLQDKYGKIWWPKDLLQRNVKPKIPKIPIK